MSLCAFGGVCFYRSRCKKKNQEKSTKKQNCAPLLTGFGANNFQTAAAVALKANGNFSREQDGEKPRKMVPSFRSSPIFRLGVDDDGGFFDVFRLGDDDDSALN